MESHHHNLSEAQQIVELEKIIAEQTQNLTFNQLGALAKNELKYAKLLFSYSEEKKLRDHVDHLKKAMLAAIDAIIHAQLLADYEGNMWNKLDYKGLFKDAFVLLGSYLHKMVYYFDDLVQLPGYLNREAMYISMAFNDLPVTAKVKLRAICHVIEGNHLLAKAVHYLPEVMCLLSIPIKRDVAAKGDNFLLLEDEPRFYKSLYFIDEEEQKSFKLKPNNQFILRIWLPDKKQKSQGRISFESIRESTGGSLWQTPYVTDDEKDSPVYLNDYVSLATTNHAISGSEFFLKEYKKSYLEFITKKLQSTDLDYVIPPIVKMIGEYTFDDPIQKPTWLKEMDYRIENRPPTFAFCFYDFDHEKFWSSWQYCLLSYFGDEDWVKINNNHVVKKNGALLALSELISYMFECSMPNREVRYCSTLTVFLNTLVNMKLKELERNPYVKYFVNPNETPLNEIIEFIGKNSMPSHKP